MAKPDRTPSAAQGRCEECELEAARMAYAAELGATEWPAFIDRVPRCTKCPESPAATVEPHLPDPMGIWTDGGDIVWLPLRYYPNRLGAFRFAKSEWSATPRDVFVTREWMRFEGLVDEEERWVACEGDAPGAFACWRLEAA